ncbi:hypothetical protein P609_11250 [Comamonas thiooxydans]|nr:hypothetical protein P609_11250 [Comamonas thiooxydans]
MDLGQFLYSMHESLTMLNFVPSGISMATAGLI